jgi:hypothetical protein
VRVAPTTASTVLPLLFARSVTPMATGPIQLQETALADEDTTKMVKHVYTAGMPWKGVSNARSRQFVAPANMGIH